MIPRYTKRFAELLYDAIEQAVGNLQPATAAFEQGFAGFAVNRRRVGHREYPGPVDHDVPVLAVKGGDGHFIAILFGYACHNTVMNDYTIHGDYAGYAQRDLEQKFPGAVALLYRAEAPTRIRCRAASPSIWSATAPPSPTPSNW